MDKFSEPNSQVEKLVWETPEITVITTEKTSGGGKGTTGPESTVTSS